MDKVIGKLKTFNRGDWTKVISTSLAILFALFSVVYFAVQTEWDDMALSFATIVYAIAPVILERLFRFRVQPVLYVFIIVYTVCPLLGSSYNFYLQFFWWDDVLHGFAGLAFAMFGAYLPYILNKKRRPTLAISALMAFVFSLAVSGVWEFIEFGFDSLFGTDMQKDTWLTDMRPSYLLGKLLGLPEGTISSGHLVITMTITYPDGSVQVIDKIAGCWDIGLIDTMHDMLIETLGALIYTIVYVAFKGKKFVLVPVKKPHPHAVTQAPASALVPEVATTEVATADASTTAPAPTSPIPDDTPDNQTA
ncbi:MAG: DUF2238 domain-containing protein [Clostridiales bacterium]|nr:DUF2238 domain-containing protein [Clostridiales bacterium]